MAVGDVVNGVGTSATLDFQPAAGVEICITSATSWNNYYIQLTDGVTAPYVIETPSTGAGQNVNMRLLINNTIYLRILNTGVGWQSYTGIQIK